MFHLKAFEMEKHIYLHFQYFNVIIHLKIRWGSLSILKPIWGGRKEEFRQVHKTNHFVEGNICFWGRINSSSTLGNSVITYITSNKGYRDGNTPKEIFVDREKSMEEHYKILLHKHRRKLSIDAMVCTLAPTFPPNKTRTDANFLLL